MDINQRRPTADDEDSYFVSTTDLMVGLLFVFIILLMYFALQLDRASKQAELTHASEQQSERRLRQEIDRLQGIDELRKEILLKIKRELVKLYPALQVSVVLEQGILRLPESILFKKSDPDLTPEGKVVAKHLARALERVLSCYTKTGRHISYCVTSHHELPHVLPCYASGPILEPQCFLSRLNDIEAIYIEGHTDNDPYKPSPAIRDNLDLSALRATNTYREIMKQSMKVNGTPMLRQFYSPDGVPILSVSGYGEFRPAFPDQKTEKQKSLNRRIDLRILMATPDPKNVREFRARLRQSYQGG